MSNFYQVNGDEIHILYALALFEAPLHQVSMLELLRLERHFFKKYGEKNEAFDTKSDAKLDINYVRDQYSNLFEIGYLDFKSGQGYSLKPTMQMSVLCHLKNNAHASIWIKSIRQLLNNHNEYQNWKAHNHAFCRREMLLSCLADDNDDVDAFFDWRSKFFLTQHDNTNNLGYVFFASEAGRELFSLFSPIIQATLLADIFHDANWFLSDCKATYDYAKNNIHNLSALSLELIDNFLWQTLLRGDYDQLSLLLKTVPVENTLHIKSILALQQGDFTSALELMNVYSSQLKLQTGKRKIYLPDILGLFYIIISLANKNQTQYILAKEQLDEGIKHRSAHSYQLFRSLVHHLANGIPLDDKQFALSHDINIDVLFQGFALLWTSTSNLSNDNNSNNKNSYSKTQDQIRLALNSLLITLKTLAKNNEYHWIQAEVDTLLQLNNQNQNQNKNQNKHLEISSPFHTRHNLKPLVQAYTSSSSWEVALNALSQLSKKPVQEKVVVQHRQNIRLAWHVELVDAVLRMEPREQKQNDKGVWSKGRAISLKRLLQEQENLPYLSEQDKSIAAFISHNNDYFGTGQFALHEERSVANLINHPAVFWMDSPDTPLDIQKGEIALQLKEKNQQISLQLVPSLHPTLDIFTVQETPTRLTVYSINKEIKKIASILGSGLTVPIEAKEQLVDVIAAIAPHLEIHSDLLGFTSHVKSIAANSIIFAHLLPFKEGLRLQLLVRPLDAGAWFAPGQGLEHIFDKRDGAAIQATRDLNREKEHFHYVLSVCPILKLSELENTNFELNDNFNEYLQKSSNNHPINHENNEWQISDPEICLELLMQLKNISEDRLQLFWPEGERFRIKSPVSSHALRLTIKKQGEWFVANGEFHLDDDRVIALRELMQLASQSKGRFLKIGNGDYVALTDNFRQRLINFHNMSDVVTKDDIKGSVKASIKVSALASNTLLDLSVEAEEVSTDEAWQEHLKKLESLVEFIPEVPSTLQAELRDYQVEGYQWLARLAHWGVGACLADDMGLGKTLQTLALLLHRAPNGPALVVAPSSVVMNWQAEITRFAPTLHIRAYHQSRSITDLGAYDIVIASYGLLQQDSELLATQQWYSLVLDEAQLIKNAGTKRSNAAMALQADFKMIISGTPVENHLGELWNLFHFINPHLLGSRERFMTTFITPIERGNKIAKMQLKKLIQAFILRRTKTQVLSELPSRTEITLQVELSDEERHLYEALRQEAINKIEQADTNNGKAMQVLTELTKLRRFCCHPQLVLKNSKIVSSKLTLLKQTIEELLANRHKVLVFSQFVDHLSIVRQYLEAQSIAYQYLDGGTPMLERKKRVDAFQSGQGDIFLISLKAGGTGLNLTAADYVIHLDPWWNPAVEDQASDRAHRMGQKRPVTIYRLVTQNTIEEQIISLHHKKRHLAEDLLEGGSEVGRMNSKDLICLLKNNSLPN